MRIIVQVRIDRGIPEEIWIAKRSVLAKTVDKLGDRFRLTLQAAWLAYIKQTYGTAVQAMQMATFSEGAFVDDDE